MILWVVLFALVVAISFVLAARSMRDFTEIPTNEQYSLFLIRKTQGLSAELLNSIHESLLRSKSIISFERLFKGAKSALVVYGPTKLLSSYHELLNLLELEDYTNVDLNHISAWEVGIKGPASSFKIEQKVFNNLPQLSDTEQFWWQILISSGLKVQIRAIVVTQDTEKRNSLTQTLHHLAPEKVVKLPKAFSNEQILEFYRTRSFKKDDKNPSLRTQDIVHLLSL